MSSIAYRTPSRPNPEPLSWARRQEAWPSCGGRRAVRVLRARSLLLVMPATAQVVWQRAPATGLDPRVAKAHGSPPVGGDRRVRDPLEGWIRMDAGLADPYRPRAVGADLDERPPEARVPHAELVADGDAAVSLVKACGIRLRASGVGVDLECGRQFAGHPAFRVSAVGSAPARRRRQVRGRAPGVPAGDRCPGRRSGRRARRGGCGGRMRPPRRPARIPA